MYMYSVMGDGDVKKDLLWLNLVILKIYNVTKLSRPSVITVVIVATLT